MDRIDPSDGIPEFQPRYVAYARDHGRSCGEMLAHDMQAWPGGRMTGFLLWVPAAWKAWAAASGEVPEWPDNSWSPRQHETFDAWLASDDRDPVEIPQ